MTAHPCPYGAHCPAVYAAIDKKVGSVLHLLKQDHVHSRLEWDEEIGDVGMELGNGRSRLVTRFCDFAAL